MLIDRNGRLFGRVNLIDAAVMVFVAVLIPTSLVAFRVFRVPPPRIDAVEPASQPAATGCRITMKGANFRPYLRVFINRSGQPFSLTDRSPVPLEGKFLIETPDEVEVELPPVTPGPYDLYLFDEARQLLMQPAAFTILPPAGVTLDVTVHFVVPAAMTPLVKVGDADIFESPPGYGDVIAAQAVIAALSPTADDPATEAARVSSTSRTQIAVTGPMQTLRARVSVPAARNGAGAWSYRGQAIAPGEAVTFETSRYSMRGVIVAVSMSRPGRSEGP